MAQFAVLIHSRGSDRGPDAAPEEREPNDRHAEVLAASGSLVLAYALTPREEAVAIRASGVTEGPFLDAPETVVGYYVLEAPDLDSAVAIARENPAVAAGGGVEVRPIESGGVR